MIESFLGYLLYNKWLSVNTITRYEKGLQYFEKYLEKIWMTLEKPEEIKLTNIYDYLAKRGKKWLSPSSLNNEINWIRGYLRYLRNILGKDVVDSAKITWVRIPEKQIWFYNKEQKMMILNAVNEWIGVKEITKLRNKLLTYMLLHTGLRCHELAKIKVKEIWESLQVIGKWGKIRTVYLRPELLDMIYDYLNKRKNKSEFLFESTKKWQHLYEWSIRALYIKLTKTLGFHVHAHGFRHTFATDLLHIPWSNIYNVAKLMGHSRITTTQLYLGVEDNELKNLQFWLNF